MQRRHWRWAFVGRDARREARRALDEFDAGGAYSRREHHGIAASTVDTIQTNPIADPSEAGPDAAAQAGVGARACAARTARPPSPAAPGRTRRCVRRPRAGRVHRVPERRERRPGCGRRGRDGGHGDHGRPPRQAGGCEPRRRRRRLRRHSASAIHGNPSEHVAGRRLDRHIRDAEARPRRGAEQHAGLGSHPDQADPRRWAPSPSPTAAPSKEGHYRRDRVVRAAAAMRLARKRREDERGGDHAHAQA